MQIKRFCGVLIDLELEDGMGGIRTIPTIGSLMPSAGDMRGLVERANKSPTQPRREVSRAVVLFYAALCATIGNDLMHRKWGNGGRIEVAANGKMVEMDSGVYMHQRALESLFAREAGHIDGRDVVLGDFWQGAKDLLIDECKFPPAVSEVQSALRRAASQAGAKTRHAEVQIAKAITHSKPTVNFFKRGDNLNIWRANYAGMCSGGYCSRFAIEAINRFLTPAQKIDVWLGVKKGIDVLAGGKSAKDYFFMVEFPIPLLKIFDVRDL